MTELLRQPVTELLERMTRREISPVELMEATLERIDATRGTLNTFSSLREPEALIREARDAEKRFAAGQARSL